MRKDINRPIITIVTPTYNRCHTLPFLYDSLCKQSSLNFKWLIIDDGSSDNTADYVASLSAYFPIRYISKENGGKHSALNIAFKEVDTELLFIVDSDDKLVANAIDVIEEEWKNQTKINNRKEGSRSLCGIGFLRGYTEVKVIGDRYDGDSYISNFITERYNKGISGDKAEVWVTEYLRDFRYPEYEGEKFISESVAWIALAKKYDMAFVNKVVYICEYLEGGLSETGRVLRFKCPRSMCYGSLMTMSKEFSLFIRIKETLLYIVYSLFGGFSWKRIFSCHYKLLVGLCAFPGWGLYHIWKKKYKVKD